MVNIEEYNRHMQLRAESPSYTSSYTSTGGTSHIFYGTWYDDWSEEKILKWGIYSYEWWNKNTDLRKYDLEKADVRRDQTDNHWVLWIPWVEK